MKTLTIVILALYLGFACFAVENDKQIVVFSDKNLERLVSGMLRKPVPLKKSDLARLDTLWAPRNDISSLEGLEFAINLKELVLTSNQIEDITPLSSLSKLKKLRLEGNRIQNITALSKLEKLEVLKLGVNEIVDISAISKLKNLSKLALQKNPLNEQAYEVIIPEIKTNNPGITIYHNRTLTPGKALAIAKKIHLALIIIIPICLIYIFVRRVSKSTAN